MSSRQARAVSLKFCNAPCTMQALLRKGFVTTQAVSFRFCYDPGGAGRFRCASTDAAGSCRGSTGAAGAAGGLQGRLGVFCAAASCSCLGCHPACWEQQPTSNAFPCIQDLLLSVQARAGQLAYFPGTRSPPPVRRVRKIESYSLTRHRGYIRPTFDLISGNLPIHSPQSSRSMRFV